LVKIINRARQACLSIAHNSSGSVRLHTIAWLLFLVCGIIYLVASIRDGDPLMIMGSACFVVAVILFLFPNRER
jgi:predicted membrane channel-forming protein YqfA (hemolysin III family)